MRFGKLMGKSMFLSMILCSVASFSLLHADNLKECESYEDREVGCVAKLYKDGNLILETPFKNGVAQGIGKVYYESGNLKAEVSLKNGKEEGIQKQYYENGDIFAEIPYTNDKINGMIKCYNEEKRLIWQATAQNGKIISGKCVSGKVMTNAHLARLTNEIDEFEIGGDYWYDICKQ